MTLTPEDILNKEFDTKFRGYDSDQVNDYLDVIVAEFEKLIGINRNLKSELDIAKEKNEYFAQLQESLNASIVVAQEAADRLKQNARKEAELIIYEAESEADNRVREANDFAQTIITETEAIRRNSQGFRNQLESMIRDHLELVTNPEYKKLLDTEVNSQFEEYKAVNISDKTAERVDRLTEVDSQSFDQAHQLKNDYVESEEMTFTPLEESSSSDENLEDFNERTYYDAVKESKEDKESVLGQTIRIELPKQ
ncbi:DivIVA domain-containing protein [Eremococcus coleocola]|uniref:DivIVA domain-containing protein n=1 Tax=Eremococcus coleocola TaxID=88132 RepID=UPI0002FA9D17|nr:DivIVA domain-containing protein [Eremococcus coleocola]